MRTSEHCRPSKHDPHRRSFIKHAAYITPVILTLKAAPAFASYGSAPVPGSDDSKAGNAFDAKGQATGKGHDKAAKNGKKAKK